MKLHTFLAPLALLSFITICPPEAEAQGAYQYSQGNTGVFGRSTFRTNNMGRSDAIRTDTQTPGKLLRKAGFGGLTRIIGPRGRNGLPPTKLDSFVKTSGYNFHIYGDEGVTLPPMNEFTPASRIIRGNLSNGLSTGHGSSLAPGWGGDEYVDTEGKSQSGPTGGAINNWGRSVSMFGLDRPDMNRGYQPSQIGSNTQPNELQYPNPDSATQYRWQQW